ncbi:diguanylate cyclase [Halomonas sp. YLGW01]|uniref:GGDEF domain-containing protein n=1 Tax=Halomonas sp. YLGW01 TaxID=2773308 RepID=UPI00177F9110|nr:diguanylate cyclase [Halomonas sp. YLGW01]
MTPRLLTPTARLLCGLALLALTVAGLSGSVELRDPGLLATTALLLGKLAWLARRPRLARGIAGVTLAGLSLGLASYLLPEYWMPTAHWHAAADALVSGTSLIDWRPPLLATLCLILLGGAQLTGRRTALGSPMLLCLALLIWLAQLGLGVTPTTRWVLDYAAAPAPLTAMGCLLMAHALPLIGLPAEERRLLIRPLLPSLLLAGMALALSQHLQLHEDRRLHRFFLEHNQRLADRLSGEVSDHLAAMRRFVNGWRLIETPPDAATWALMAEPLSRDFGYFVNIALIEPDTRIRYVHPMSEANRGILGMKLSERQPAGRRLQRQALVEHREAATDVIPLLQGEYGIIYYLPTRIADGRFIGASAMVLSLQALIDTLRAPIDEQKTRLELRQASTPLAILGAKDGNRHWAHTAQIDIGRRPLELTTQPSRQHLLEAHARLPAVTLATGLGLAYLLFLVLYAHRHLAVQHRLLHDSHARLRRESEARSRLQQEIEWLARHDELTKLPNRRLLMETLRAHHDTRPLCVMLCDLDHFKRINDTMGHLAGDACLNRMGELGQTVAERAGGLFARYGGEEFVLLLPNCDTARGREVAEELRRELQAARLRHHDGSLLTVSIGLAEHARGPLAIAPLMQAADEALYRAKAQGRNRVVSAPLSA